MPDGHFNWKLDLKRRVRKLSEWLNILGVVRAPTVMAEKMYVLAERFVCHVKMMLMAGMLSDLIIEKMFSVRV